VAGAWHQNVGAIAAGTVNYDESISVKGYKLGGRFGLEYTVNKNWSVNALLQYTELGMDHYETKGINPSWLQFGAKYHF
jgi:opacity protein-like surface antigen